MANKPTIKQAVASKVADVAQDMVGNHWDDIIDTEDEDGVVSVNLTFKYGTSTRALKSKISYSKKFGDEREDVVDDPNQTKMNLGGE